MMNSIYVHARFACVCVCVVSYCTHACSVSNYQRSSDNVNTEARAVAHMLIAARSATDMNMTGYGHLKCHRQIEQVALLIVVSKYFPHLLSVALPLMSIRNSSK